MKFFDNDLACKKLSKTGPLPDNLTEYNYKEVMLCSDDFKTVFIAGHIVFEENNLKKMINEGIIHPVTIFGYQYIGMDIDDFFNDKTILANAADTRALFGARIDIVMLARKAGKKISYTNIERQTTNLISNDNYINSVFVESDTTALFPAMLVCDNDDDYERMTAWFAFDKNEERGVVIVDGFYFFRLLLEEVKKPHHDGHHIKKLMACNQFQRLIKTALTVVRKHASSLTENKAALVQIDRQTH